MARRGRALALIPVVLVLVASGCGADDDAATPTPDRDATPTEAPNPTAPEDTMPTSGPVTEAIADLADATGMASEDIEVVAHDQVTWRDGSLGCPEPGKMYTQALVDGYRIVLRAGGETVHYHGGTGRSPFRCDHPDPNGTIDQRG